MLTLHLVRHGDTEQSSDGVFCGDLDPPLTPRGLKQAARIADVTSKLGLTALYVSPKQRARLTAEPTLKATGLAPIVEDGLREIGYGTWEGRKEVEIKQSEPEDYAAWVADPAVHAPPGGESGYAIAARAIPVVERIRTKHKSGAVLVVSHKATIRVVTCALLGLHVGRFRDRVACPTASLTSFEFGERGPMLVRIADTKHLENLEKV
jgi:probable phosphoglycerate mutase